MLASMLLEGDVLRLGKHLRVSIQRTLRVHDRDPEVISALPVSLGCLPLAWAVEYPAALTDWQGDLFVPMHEREAIWLGFSAPDWHPCALRVGVGGFDAVSGLALTKGLMAEPQNYLVCPPQPWLDGVNAGHGHVRQFVALPLGSGLTIEGQLSGREHIGAIQLVLHEATPGRFPDQEPSVDDRPEPLSLPQAGRAIGLAPGGQIRQRIYRDPYGLKTWQAEPSASITIHLLDSKAYEFVTGMPAPPPPIDEQTYRDRGLPWLDLDDDALPALPPATSLRDLKSLPAETLPEQAPPVDRSS